ncbi:glycosyltransferase [Bacteroides fragilis]
MFLYVGRLSEEKNLQYLIETFNSLPSLQLTIIGFGPQEIYLKK